jgi:Tfp pilus assembly protein PilZ
MFWQGINQRKFPRACYRCRIKVEGKTPDLILEALTENIGAGGICVKLEDRFELFEDVALEIYLDDGKKPVNCTGMIVWVVKHHPMTGAQKAMYDMGIEFLNICREDKKRIEKLVDKLLTM